MGFKFKRIDFAAGTAEFPTGNSDANIRTRCEVVLKGLADSLLAMNIGWRLDPNRSGDSSTTSDFANVPCQSGSKTYPALFFDNTVSGCKLFLASFSGYIRSSEVIKNFSGSDLIGIGTGPYISGIIASIIPAGSNSTFGATFDASFLPSDATRLVGTNNSGQEYGTSYNPMLLRDPTSGYIYSYGLYANEYAMGIACNLNGSTLPNLYTPVYITGRIIGTLAHAEDTGIKAKYGTVLLRGYESFTNAEGRQSLRRTKYDYRLGQDEDIYVPFISPISYDRPYGSNNGKSWVCGCITKANGTWINGAIDDAANVVMWVADIGQLSSNMFNSNGNGKSRWVPVGVAVVSSDLSTNGVVSGDGFKGYLDENLFRCALGTYGQTFDNGNFICPNNDVSFLIGWDPTNTDSIAGA